jgi:hypothetical protein
MARRTRKKALFRPGTGLGSISNIMQARGCLPTSFFHRNEVDAAGIAYCFVWLAPTPRYLTPGRFESLVRQLRIRFTAFNSTAWCSNCLVLRLRSTALNCPQLRLQVRLRTSTALKCDFNSNSNSNCAFNSDCAFN